MAWEHSRMPTMSDPPKRLPKPVRNPDMLSHQASLSYGKVFKLPAKPAKPAKVKPPAKLAFRMPSTDPSQSYAYFPALTSIAERRKIEPRRAAGISSQKDEIQITSLTQELNPAVTPDAAPVSPAHTASSRLSTPPASPPASIHSLKQSSANKVKKEASAKRKRKAKAEEASPQDKPGGQAQASHAVIVVKTTYATGGFPEGQSIPAPDHEQDDKLSRKAREADDAARRKRRKLDLTPEERFERKKRKKEKKKLHLTYVAGESARAPVVEDAIPPRETVRPAPPRRQRAHDAAAAVSGIIADLVVQPAAQILDDFQVGSPLAKKARNKQVKLGRSVSKIRSSEKKTGNLQPLLARPRSGRLATAYDPISTDDLQTRLGETTYLTHDDTVLLGWSLERTAARSLQAAVKGDPKPFLDDNARPPAWALTRQELCETLPYYRSYQSGLYMSAGIAYGYLIDDFGALRDTCSNDGRVIISHGGGNAGCFKSADGIERSILKGDQNEDAARIATLLNAAKKRTPMVLIAGANYSELPWRLKKQRYVVLGWYWISAHWVEAEFPAESAELAPGRPYFHRLKLRFDWCDAQGDPWWTTGTETTEARSPSPPPYSHDGDQDSETAAKAANQPTSGGRLVAPTHVHKLLPNPVELPSDLMTRCAVCGDKSPRVYQDAICLQPACAAFWRQKVDGGQWKLIDGRSTLQYNDTFLKMVPTPASMSMLPYDLYDIKQSSTATARGFLCTACRKACCRADWYAPTCNECGQVNPDYWPRTTQKEVGRSPGLSLDFEGEIKTRVGKDFYATKYIFEDIDSAIYHLRPLDTKMTDDLWNGYLQLGSERQGLLIRAAMREHAMRDELLSQQYTFNSGQAYKYLVATKSSAFEDSPRIVLDARDYVVGIVKTMIPDKDSQFNQLMSVAYRPDQRMNWHDDGEAGLGPCIAAISLGSDSEFLVRRKKGKAPPKPYRRPKSVAPGAVPGSEKKSDAPVNENKPTEDSEDDPPLGEEDDKLEPVPEVEEPIAPRSTAKPRAVSAEAPVLTLRLRHGDIVIMHGSRLQKYYQHKAEPTGARVVGTLRSIDGEINSAAQSLRKRRPAELSRSPSQNASQPA